MDPELAPIESRSQSDGAETILLLSKIASMVVLGLGSLVMGTLPLLIGRCRTKKVESRRPIGSPAGSTLTVNSSSYNSKQLHNHHGHGHHHHHHNHHHHHHSSQADPAQQGLLTSLLLCFGGGVLLFTTFLHLAPEVRESVESHQSSNKLPSLETLSLAELLFCAGFFFVYLVEEAVHAALTGHPESQETLLYRTVSVRRCNSSGLNGSASSHSSGTSNNNNNVLGNSLGNHHNQPQNHSYNHQNQQNQQSQANHQLQTRQQRNSRSSNSAWSSSSNEDRCSGSGGGKSASAVFVLGEPVDSQQLRPMMTSAVGTVAVKHHHHHHEGAAMENSLRSLLTVLALSFHAIFEGLAVGLEPALSSVVYLALAIATHKLVISFCVGMELWVAGASSRTILGYLSVFSMVTPLGIAVGIALAYMKNDSETLGPTPTILQGMAAGTLLYVVFFEVLARERANDKSGLLQLAAIMVGFMLMLGLQIATAHSHEHGHSHSHGEEEAHSHSHDGNDSLSIESTTLGKAIEGATHRVMRSISSSLT